MIPASFIQDLLTRVDILDVVGASVQLKKGGANYMGLCPFHGEKSPSFTVSPAKQFYHCFGCGAHGTAIGFLMEYAGLNFVEAVKDLAQGIGLAVPEEDERITPQARAQTQAVTLALSEVMTRANDYYRRQLRLDPRAIAYLKQRGLTGEIAAQFGIGYAPDGWQNLAAEFADYQTPALLQAGLVKDSGADEGEEEADGNGLAQKPRRRYDRFRDRIMFPIRNTKGQVIAFGGRVIDAGEPKYLNSPETPLFSKGYELYGLFEARQAIRQAAQVLVVEGYMDVVALAQAGIGHAVATLGTACTAHHVQKLLRQSDNVVFSFDGDAAGRKAARRALEASLPFAADDKTIAFLFLPSEHDPDTYVRELGLPAFEQAVREAMPLSRFLLQLACEDCALENAEGKALAIQQAKPMLQALPAAALRMSVLRELASKTGLLADEIQELCELSQMTRHAKKARARVKRSAPAPLEQKLLHLLLGEPWLAMQLSTAEEQTLQAHQGDYADALQGLISLARANFGSESTQNALQSTTLRDSQFAAWMETVKQSPWQDVLGAVSMQQLTHDITHEHATLAERNHAHSAKNNTAQSQAEQDANAIALAEWQGALLKMEFEQIKTQTDALVKQGLQTAEARAHYQSLQQRQKVLRTQMTF